VSSIDWDTCVFLECALSCAPRFDRTPVLPGGKEISGSSDRGGMRRTWLRGRENVHKRYLVHVAGHNLGILMRLLIGAGTPGEAAARGLAYLFFVYTEEAAVNILVVAFPDGFAILVAADAADPRNQNSTSATGC
jgi:hypothetical protein